MATQVQNRRGTTAEHSTFTGAVGELTVDTTKDTVVVHDGAVAGGRPLLREDQSNLPTSAPTTGIYNASGSLAISTGGSGRLFVDASGRVGIGTSPSSLLHTSQASGFNIFQQDSGSVGNYLYADSTGLGWVGTRTNHPFVFGTNNSERLRITSAGLVGVGTSSPFTILHSAISITGGNPASSGTTDANVIARFQGGSVGLDIGGTASGAQWIQPRSVNNFATNYGLLLCPNGGNVGIGTTSPTHSLDVNSAIRLRGAGASTEEGDLHLYYVSDSNRATVTSSTNGAIVFENGIGAVSERARIDSSGRLLVGTSSGSGNNLFQVRGSTLGAGYPGGAFFNIGLDVASVDSNFELGRLDFGNQQGYLGASIVAAADLDWNASDYPSRLVFSTTADGASSPTERMRISNDGSIYFGSTSATAPSMYFSPDSAGGRFIKNTNSTNSRTAFTFQINGTDVGSITTSGSSTAYNTSSDYRLKENVASVTDGITRLRQLKPSRFNFIADPAKTVDGFIAHEVQAVVPEAITGEKDAVDDDGNPIYQGIDQSKLVPLLTAALQEAVAKIESLETRLTAAGI